MEFWMIEPEVAYAELNEMMDLAEAFLTSIIARVLDRRCGALKRTLNARRHPELIFGVLDNFDSFSQRSVWR